MMLALESRALAGFRDGRETLCDGVCRVMQLAECEDGILGAAVGEEDQRALIPLRCGAMFENRNERGKLLHSGNPD